MRNQRGQWPADTISAGSPPQNNFSRAIDPAKTISAGSLTTLKWFQQGFWPRWIYGPAIFFIENIQLNYFIVKYIPMAHTLAKKCLGNLDFIFICETVSLFIRGLYGVDEKTDGRKSRVTVPLKGSWHNIRKTLRDIALSHVINSH
jgi:hypothetical protein